MLIAVVQMTSTEDRKLNIEKAVHYIEEAANRGAQIVALPEHFSYMKIEGSPYPFAEKIDGELITTISKSAKKNNIYILAGSFPETIEASEKTYNTTVFINPQGDPIGIYRKIHLFDYNVTSQKSLMESRLVEGGTEAVLVDTEFGKIGLTICYDLRFPELFRNLALRGAKIVFMPSAFLLNTGKDHWQVLLRARAIENQLYIAAPNQFGKHAENRISYGHSMIVSPWGTPIAIAQDKEELIAAEVDFHYLEEIRQKLPCLGHTQDFLFGFPN